MTSREGADSADIVLIGAGIMSATLASMLTVLDPSLKVVVLERADRLASESSDPWNNAGTGHSGYCELNYMPDPTDGRKAEDISRQFHITRQWWSFLVSEGLLDPTGFVHGTPHLDIVFGEKDVRYLRSRYQTLSARPFFEEMEYTEDPAVVAQWAPLMMAGRDTGQPIAATRHLRGTDVDFGALTEQLMNIVTGHGGIVRTNAEVTNVFRRRDERWGITMTDTSNGRQQEVVARQVFAGAGGFALKMLQKAEVPEVRGYGVLPVGAAFYRCDDPDVVDRHAGKVYGQAPVGAPPMSVPHLDKRVVNGRGYLMFGPYATFSTRLLKSGGLADFFTTVTLRNLPVLVAAGVQNLSLVRFLISELAASPRRKFAQLRKFFPQADSSQWELMTAGQRAQLVVPDRKRIGELRQGTELVVSGDCTISGLLGASPGASTAVPIMLDLLQRCFPEKWAESWEERLSTAIPDMTRREWTSEDVRRSFAVTEEYLGLSSVA